MGLPKERPILFSAPMVRAILDGKKIQTRRIVRATAATKWLLDGDWSDDYVVAPGNLLLEACPYGAAGDRLWVRETFIEHDIGHVQYRADYKSDPKEDRAHGVIWSPSIFMRRRASRITLAVESVRVERLQAITEDGARAEGVKTGETVPALIRRRDPDGSVTEGRGSVTDFTYRGAFCRLWDSLNGVRAPWERNPWVWVVGFKLVQP